MVTFHGGHEFFRHDQAGKFMVSASSEGPIFFYSSKPSANFEVLGYLGMLTIVHVTRILGLKFTEIYAKKNRLLV